MIENATELKELKQLLTTYGMYEVLKAIQRTEQESSKDYHSGAVIHRDLVNLNECIRTMKGNHILRGLSEA